MANPIEIAEALEELAGRARAGELLSVAVAYEALDGLERTTDSTHLAVGGASLTALLGETGVLHSQLADDIRTLRWDAAQDDDTPAEAEEEPDAGDAPARPKRWLGDC